ncbi:hypothetical protein, partial [Pseudogemmobacter sonorensis]|uniref:hypothetical protein n=1 Tax=Pseudogemmobacter sonorensis TaxID=2989681 RepID=UPI0036757A56
MSVETSFVGLRLVPGDPAITPEMLAGVRDMFGGRPLTAATPEAALEAGGTALVLLRDPAQVLATALLSAPGAEAALHDWRQWAQALLRRRRQDRGRMHLVDIDLLADPETGGPDAAALGRLGALVGMAILRAPAVPMPGRAPDPVLALAEGLLARDRQDALLVAELEAETHRPAREADPFERVDRALSALRLAERERGLQRETMGLQVSEIERQARGLVAAKTEAQAQAARFAALEE